MSAVPRLALIALAGLSLAASAAARGREPGSVLVFTVHRSGPGFFTVVSVTNTNTQAQTPFSFGGSASAHYEYVNITPNPANPFEPLGCTVFNRFEFFTPGDTLSVLTSCHNAVGPQGAQGYLVVSATALDAFGQTTGFNYFVGSELVINGSGGMYALNAVPFDALGPTNGGTLDFNGVEYEEGPDKLVIDSFLAVAGSQLALLNFTGGPDARNTVQFEVWNDNEFPLSTTLTFRCWFDQPLTTVSPLFSEAFLKGTMHDLGELDITCNGVGSLETGWARIESVGVFSSGGGFVAADGVVLGSISAGPTTEIDGGHLLWESKEKQPNGSF